MRLSSFSLVRLLASGAFLLAMLARHATGLSQGHVR
jgi:hypothetical protein